jgi:8-oxo-dGTP pyrophosphatase MutT (NUDIX family)
MRPDYIRWLRQRVGPEPVLLNFSAACVVDDGAVLLQRRSDDGLWGLPGGAIELGESAAEAAKREVKEETGLDVHIEDLLGIYTKYEHTYPNGDRAQPITVFFRCTPITSQPPAATDEETIEVAYHPLDALPPLTNQQHRDALADLSAGRSGVYR